MQKERIRSEKKENLQWWRIDLQSDPAISQRVHVAIARIASWASCEGTSK
jgi:hypothetical protein